jgi:hypothetical protein
MLGQTQAGLSGTESLADQKRRHEQAVMIEVLQATSRLSLEIYSALAVDYLISLDSKLHQHADREALKSMAKNAHLAAQAYFEGLGITFPEQENRR